MKTSKIIAGITAIAVSAGCTLVYADNRDKKDVFENKEQDQNVTETISPKKTESELKAMKSETVYANASYTGNIKNITVSNWLKNPGSAGVIEDVSNLKNIKNIKGDQTYTEEGGTVKWQADGSDIFYQGTTDQQLPVTMKVTYFLDGKEISPEALEGRDGKVTIRFDYTNNEFRTYEINGKKYEVSVPFLAATGMILDSDKFTNIQVKNGKVVSDGSRCFVLGGALPGFKDSIDLDSFSSDDIDLDFDIPDYFEVTADVAGFSLETTVTVVTNEFFNDIDIDAETTVNDLKNTIKELSDASDKLVDGSSSLYDGIETLLEKSGDLTAGIDKLADGAGTLDNGAKSLDDGAASLKAGISQLTDGIKQLSQNTPALINGSDEFNNGLKLIQSKLSTVTADASQISQLVTYSSQIKSGIEQLNSSIAQLKQGVSSEAMKNTFKANGLDTDTLSDGNKACIASISEQIKQLTEQLQKIKGVTGYEAQEAQLDAQIKSLSNIVTVLGGDEAYINASQQYINTLGDAVTQLYEGSSKLNDSYAQFDGAVNQLAAKLAETTENISALKNGIDQLAQAYGGIDSGIKAYTGGVTALYNGCDQLTAGVAKLTDGTSSLKNGSAQLTGGISELQNGGKSLIDGIVKLRDGSKDLKDGMAEFDEKGIQKISDIVNNDMSGLTDRIQAISRASKDYNSFSGKSESMDGSVKFIIETDKIG